MYSIAALEIDGGSDGKLPVELLLTAYRASRRGRIVLILKGVLADIVDEAVDPLVHRMRLDIPGLLYVDGRDEARVSAAIQDTIIVFAPHERLAAEQMLDRLARPTRISEIEALGRVPVDSIAGQTSIHR